MCPCNSTTVCGKQLLESISLQFSEIGARQQLHLGVHTRDVLEDTSKPSQRKRFQKCKCSVSDGYLKHLALRTLIKEQVLLVERLQGLSCNLGFLFGFACTVIQQVHFDIGSWRRKEGRGGRLRKEKGAGQV